MFELLRPISLLKKGNKTGKEPLKSIVLQYTNPQNTRVISRLVLKVSCYQEPENIPIKKKNIETLGQLFTSFIGLSLLPSDIKSICTFNIISIESSYDLLIKNKFYWTIDFIYKIVLSVCISLSTYINFISTNIYVTCISASETEQMCHCGFGIQRNSMKLTKPDRC